MVKRVCAFKFIHTPSLHARVFKKSKVLKFLLKRPWSLMQADAGNRPSRPLRPPIHGFSKNVTVRLLWNGSSQAGFEPLTETHLKHSIPAAEIKALTHNRFIEKKHKSNLSHKASC